MCIFNGLFSHKREGWTIGLSNKLNKSHTRQEKQILYDFAYTWNLKKALKKEKNPPQAH